MLRTITRPVRVCYENIIRVLRWIPVIWKDREFDQAYLYRIIHFKLLNMERFFESDHAWAVHTKKELRKLKIARILADRLGNQEPYEYESIFDWCEEKDVPPIGSIPVTVQDKWLMKMRREMRHRKYMHQQDKDMLFRYMRKHIDTWWD